MFSSFSIKHADQKTKSDVWQTISVTLLISFIPLILGFIVSALNNKVSVAFNSVFLSGELYFYAMSLCGTIYATSQTNTHDQNLGMRMWSGVFVFSCGCFMALYIGLSGNEHISGKAFHGTLSILFFISAVLLIFRVTVLATQPPPPPEQIHRERADEIIESLDPDYDS